MFHTLRSKLVLSYILLVLLCLILLGLAAGALITRVQRRANLQRTQALAILLARRLHTWAGSLDPQALLGRIKREGERLQGHLLILNEQGRILIDSKGSYVGVRIPLRNIPTTIDAPPTILRHTFADGREYFIVIASLPPPPRAEAFQGRYLGIALQVREVDPPWRELFLPLLLIGGGVMLIAIAVGFVLANSIARPVREMTQAAQEIARGNYQQVIHAHGQDEIAQLARSFSQMAQEVARAQRTQRDFLANISHDLRTPLTSIQGFSQAILEGAIRDEAGYRRAAEIIKEEAERMATLVEDLLELARLEGGQLELQRERLSLKDLLEKELTQMRHRAEEKGLQLQVSLPQELPPIYGDSHWLSRALANVLDNAFKYSPPGSSIIVKVSHVHAQAPHPAPLPVSFGPSIEKGEWVSIEVRNPCEPIGTEELHRLFERFYRGDRSRRRSEGSGLGLAIVREAILAHGGRVEASYDAKGGEVLFRLWLPITS
ncbi:MAG: sensor histidine kinase [Anaerolineae bacterium]|nr:sensor histidine kinase [Anaerolineae bacterium]